MTPPLLRQVLLVGVAALLSSATSRADIYRYVDKDGVVHFQNHAKKGRLVARSSPRGKSPRMKPFLPQADASRQAQRFDRYIKEAAALYQIPTELVRAVIKVESNFDPRAVSHADARGLMQLIPVTAERMVVTDVFDPRQNIFGGVRYLRVLANLFNGNLELTVAAYNAGEGAVIRYGGIPPYPETQHYVVKVLSHYHQYRSTGLAP